MVGQEEMVMEARGKGDDTVRGDKCGSSPRRVNYGAKQGGLDPILNI